MGLFSHRARKPAVQRLTPLELALSLAAITGRNFDTTLKSATQLGFKTVPLELFVFGVFATLWNASRHALLTGLTEAQRRAVTDAYAVLAYCLWTDGREGLSKRLPAALDWRHFLRFRQTIDWGQYGAFTDVVRERTAEYGPLAGVPTTGSRQGTLGIELGNAIARHVLDPRTKMGPMQSLWCAGLFQEMGTAVPGALNHYRYRPDPEAEAHAATMPDEPAGDVILTCGACGQKNRVRAGRRRSEAVCGRCHSPL